MGGPDIDASRIAAAIAPIMAEHLAAARQAWVAREEAFHRRQEALLDACRAVGQAVDQLAQDRYTPRETLARRKLEEAATQLRTIMRKRGGARG